MGQPRALVRKKREAQDRVLALLATGHTITECMQAVARRRTTFYRWCDEEPWFKDRAYALRDGEKHDEVGFVEFRRMYFDMTTPWHQHKIIDAIESAGPRSITIILVPPGAGKTAVMEDYLCWMFAKTPNFRACVISQTQALGKKVLRRISNRMTDTGRFGAFIRRYGPFRPADREANTTWNKTQLTLLQMSSAERDYSLEVLGAGGQIYGSQYDLIVLDDVQTLKTLGQTDTLIDYFRQEVYSRVERANSTGKIVIVGTRVGHDDLYERMLSVMGTAVVLVRIPALIEHPDEEGNVESYFPKKVLADGRELGFSLADLERTRATVGEEVWSRNYMQEPVSKRGQTFTEQMVAGVLNEERMVALKGADDPAVPGVLRIGSLDPALVGHCAFMVSSFDYERLYLLDRRSREGIGRYEDMWDIIEELSALWRPQVWVIEGNAIQGGIARSDRILELAKRYGFRIEAHQTGRNKADETIGVASMAGSFIRREIDIPWGDDLSKETFGQLCEELRRWRPDVPGRLLRQDEVMALWFTHLHWQRMRSDLACRVERTFQARGLPWKPTGYHYLRERVGA